MFDQHTGNSPVKAVLKRMLTNNRLPGAMLFIGEEGVGKKLFALEVARALNCRSAERSRGMWRLFALHPHHEVELSATRGC